MGWRWLISFSFKEVKNMSALYLCQIPEFSSDYKNVANFSSKSAQLKWMNSKVIMTATTNAKLDNFTSSVVLSQSMSTNLRKCA